MTSIHRRAALRTARAFRTVSYDAVCVIAGMTPIDLLTDEKTRMYRKKRGNDSDNLRSLIDQEKAKTLAKWQERWDSSEKGRWTYRLIPDVAVWVGRKHGDVDHYFCQLLSGHGCFREYQCPLDWIMTQRVRVALKKKMQNMSYLNAIDFVLEETS